MTSFKPALSFLLLSMLGCYATASDSTLDNSNETPAAAEVNAATSVQAGQVNTAVKVNIVEVTETFYRMKYDPDTNVYREHPVTEAKPGDLIKLVINAENKSDQVLTDVEMTHTIPQGPVRLLKDSLLINDKDGLFRLSRNGETFFPPDAEISADEIKFIQWVVYSMQPGDVFQLSYQIQIDY